MADSKDLRISISLNGDPLEVPAGVTVHSLLEHLRIEPSRVAVERNRVIVRRPDWASTPVLDGDQIEIVQFVGGG